MIVGNTYMLHGRWSLSGYYKPVYRDGSLINQAHAETRTPINKGEVEEMNKLADSFQYGEYIWKLR